MKHKRLRYFAEVTVNEGRNHISLSAGRIERPVRSVPQRGENLDQFLEAFLRKDPKAKGVGIEQAHPRVDRLQLVAHGEDEIIRTWSHRCRFVVHIHLVGELPAKADEIGLVLNAQFFERAAGNRRCGRPPLFSEESAGALGLFPDRYGDGIDRSSR